MAMGNGWGHVFKGLIKISANAVKLETRDSLYSTYVHEMVHIARYRLLLPYDKAANERYWPPALDGASDMEASEGETVLMTAFVLRDNLPKYEGKTLMEIVDDIYEKSGEYYGYAEKSFGLLGEEGVEAMINTIREHAHEEL